MNGMTARKNIEQRQARLLEASLYPGPIAAALVSSEEKSRLVAEAAEQRRLLREAGMVVDRVSIRDRVSLATRQFVAWFAARRSGRGPVVPSPDHA